MTLPQEASDFLVVFRPGHVEPDGFHLRDPLGTKPVSGRSEQLLSGSP